jgi:hypothetical protein
MPNGSMSAARARVSGDVGSANCISGESMSVAITMYTMYRNSPPT